MRNASVPDNYTVEPNTRLKTRHDASELPVSLRAALKRRADSHYTGDPRSEEMASNIACQLLGGPNEQLPFRTPEIVDESYIAICQKVEQAWSRTFAERLEEAVRKYKNVSRTDLRRDLTEAWWNIEQIITRHDAMS